LPETASSPEKICSDKFWQIIMPNKRSRSENGSIGTSLALDNQRLFGFLSWLRGWRIRLLPHEYAFSLFLALTAGRLVARAGLTSPLSLAFLGFLLASAVVILWSGPDPAPWRWRVRLLLYPALMGLSFYMIPSVVAALHVPRADALLVKWDLAWLGQNINLAIQGWEPPLLTDLLMLSYVFFFYYLIAGPAYYCIRDLPRFRQCFAGLFVVYALGFIGYTFFPAGGPHRFLEFEQPLKGAWITRLAKPVLDFASNGVDAFPSIHVAISLYLLVFDRWYYRRRFWWLLLPCVALWVSTVYLRYHYCVDVMAGFAIGAVGLWVADLHGKSRLKAGAGS
jgi:membrane-associated phospholipid phosphatase